MKKISICIPAYKRPQNLRRLFHSIREQTYRDFDIVLTDDSPDDSVEKVLGEFSDLPVRYFKNIPPLGTPANWNRGISLAEGEWIKLMHDDDWFRSAGSLQRFAEEIGYGKKFIFCRYVNVFESGKEQMPSFPSIWKEKILRQPLNLLSENVIGPPSVTLAHRSITERYDERMKWRVDLDFYIRLLKTEQTFSLIPEPLVNVGISETQVTNDCLNYPEVELPEGNLLLKKYGLTPLRTLRVYDAWWRILRNNGVRSETDLLRYTPGDEWPHAIQTLVGHQTLVPQKLLRIGVLSKSAMFLSYLFNRRNLRS